ncbi:MAG TPA: site-2 protease family protein, partial [Candidatus Nanoarchaeia archaeon]|nr:site-2 protease family protein [Candidatus Nanoarchaeia archaeon]
SSIGGFFYHILEWFNGLQNNGRGFLFWLYALSFGIGLFNLLPLPIVDGGRMVQTGLKRKYGEERGNVIYGKVSLAFFILLIASFIVPAVV